ncbi:MAG: cation-translocating P-type ATPase [Bacteroidia bacterium]|nr:cation-translocating P-type ATPase [Bacteroidia bacterium]
MSTDKITLPVEGMTCSNCALTVTKVFEKEGLRDVNVNIATSEVSFQSTGEAQINAAITKAAKFGYRVHQPATQTDVHAQHQHSSHSTGTEKRFYICLAFTIPLLIHMIPGAPHFFHNPFVQLSLSLPVILIGLSYFGKSALGSLRAGVPNMDVLVTLGSLSAFGYSIAVMVLFYGAEDVHTKLFFETAAAIITLVLLGNLLEQRSVKKTASAIQELNKLQPKTAKLITKDSATGNEIVSEINFNDIRQDDVLLVNTGDSVPVDGRIFQGEAEVNESMLTGESIPVLKSNGDNVTGGTILNSGTLRVVALKVGSETTLAKIVELVKNAQNTKPQIQKIGDKVSAVFVPVVVGIAVLIFLVSFFIIEKTLQDAVMNSIAVLVISCPCAMGLAAPTAVMVGIGRAAKKGILIKEGSIIEKLAKAKIIVFDKTGTLTTGKFRIKNINAYGGDEKYIRFLIYHLEKNSSHPIAKSLVKECESDASYQKELIFTSVTEDKGTGINANDNDGNIYSIGSFRIVKHMLNENNHNIYLLKNNQLIGGINIQDELKKDVSKVIAELKLSGIRTVLLSGDKKEICDAVAREAGIDEVHSEVLPADKLMLIEKLSKEEITAMVGDGINDAPALAKAHVGISISDATQVAVQAAQVVLLNTKDLGELLVAIRLCRKTVTTIKQNFFWAFFYNAAAIPLAAIGMLGTHGPMISAFSMAFSDVVVIGNSLRLKIKRI